MSRKNVRCPECTSNGHDSDGDHLFLMEKGDRWCCNKVEYHSQSQYFFCPADPDTGDPVLDIPKDEQNGPLDESKTAPDTLGTAISEGKGDRIYGPEQLPSDVEFRGIPAATRKKYGVRHGFSEVDQSMQEVYYPIYEGGKQVAWKCRTVETKDFRIEEVRYG